MLTRVETLKRNATQQTNCFQNLDERLQRLEEMQSSTLQMLNVLVQNLQTSNQKRQSSHECQTSKLSEGTMRNDDDDDDDSLHFSPTSTPDELKIPISTLLSSAGSRGTRSSSFSQRLVNPSHSLPNSTAPSALGHPFSELPTIKVLPSSSLTTNDERLGIGTTNIGGSGSTLTLPDDTSHQNLYKAEETEHSIYGKLIKERFRKLSEVVEDIERTLPSHHQRHEHKQDKSDITDDDETLSTLDWVDTATGRVACNSTRVSRFDVNQEEITTELIGNGKKNDRKTVSLIESEIFCFS